MRQINPLYILLLVVFILFFVLFNLNAQKKRVVSQSIVYDKTLELGTKLSALTNLYGDKKEIKKRFKKVINFYKFKQLKMKTLYKGSSIYLKIEKIDKQNLNTLMARMLNSTLEIESLRVKKLNQSSAFIEMEIAW